MIIQGTADREQWTEILSSLRHTLETAHQGASDSKLCSMSCHLTTDSRAVRQGDIFIAYPGDMTDGRHFISQAIKNGASAIIWESKGFKWNPAWQIPNVDVKELRHKAGYLADAFYDSPSQKLWLTGITGTNGKTSTSHWIAQALNDARKKCALIGTLGNGFINALQPSANTTPDAICVHTLLAEYVNTDAHAVAMEVSSHALAQGRVNGVSFDVALLTNLSRDHLDYHGNMESYAASKRKLFDLQKLKYAVINLDDAFGVSLVESLREGETEIIGYGLSDSALQFAERFGLRMVYGNLLEMTPSGMKLAVHSSWGGTHIHSSLIGYFNAANLLGALAVLLVSGLELAEAALSLSKVQPVAGRMQRIVRPDVTDQTLQPTVIIDYAHTPDALEKVLMTLRDVSATRNGRLICVFGCGGDRDRGKRPMMGRVAEKFSDYSIVTSDNPRSEDPQLIIAEILAGMTAQNHEVIFDRAEAIRHAISFAQQNDLVLIAGKGHEDYQEINGIKHPFSDAKIALQALCDTSMEMTI